MSQTDGFDVHSGSPDSISIKPPNEIHFSLQAIRHEETLDLGFIDNEQSNTNEKTGREKHGNTFPHHSSCYNTFYKSALYVSTTAASALASPSVISTVLVGLGVFLVLFKCHSRRVFSGILERKISSSVQMTRTKKKKKARHKVEQPINSSRASHLSSTSAAATKDDISEISSVSAEPYDEINITEGNVSPKSLRLSIDNVHQTEALSPTHQYGGLKSDNNVSQNKTMISINQETNQENPIYQEILNFENQGDEGKWQVVQSRHHKTSTLDKIAIQSGNSSRRSSQQDVMVHHIRSPRKSKYQQKNQISLKRFHSTEHQYYQRRNVENSMNNENDIQSRDSCQLSQTTPRHKSSINRTNVLGQPSESFNQIKSSEFLSIPQKCLTRDKNNVWEGISSNECFSSESSTISKSNGTTSPHNDIEELQPQFRTDFSNVVNSVSSADGRYHNTTLLKEEGKNGFSKYDRISKNREFESETIKNGMVFYEIPHCEKSVSDCPNVPSQDNYVESKEMDVIQDSEICSSNKSMGRWCDIVDSELSDVEETTCDDGKVGYKNLSLGETKCEIPFNANNPLREGQFNQNDNQQYYGGTFYQKSQNFQESQFYQEPRLRRQHERVRAASELCTMGDWRENDWRRQQEYYDRGRGRGRVPNRRNSNYSNNHHTHELTKGKNSPRFHHSERGFDNQQHRHRNNRYLISPNGNGRNNDENRNRFNNNRLIDDGNNKRYQVQHRHSHHGELPFQCIESPHYYSQPSVKGSPSSNVSLSPTELFPHPTESSERNDNHNFVSGVGNSNE